MTQRLEGSTKRDLFDRHVKLDHVAAAVTPVATESAVVGINHQRRVVVLMEWAAPPKGTAGCAQRHMLSDDIDDGYPALHLCDTSGEWIGLP